MGPMKNARWFTTLVILFASYLMTIVSCGVKGKPISPAEAAFIGPGRMDQRKIENRARIHESDQKLQIIQQANPVANERVNEKTSNKK